MRAESTEITHLLMAWRNVNWRESPGHLLQTTALVHEAYLRLVEENDRSLRNPLPPVEIGG